MNSKHIESTLNALARICRLSMALWLSTMTLALTILYTWNLALTDLLDLKQITYTQSFRIAVPIMLALIINKSIKPVCQLIFRN